MSALPHENQTPAAPRMLPGAERICFWTVILAAGVALILGLTNLLVWLGPARAAAFWPGVMVMRLNTALGISAAAVSLLLWQLANPRTGWARLAAGLGFFVALIGGLTALQDLAGIDLGVDQFFGATTFPGDRAQTMVVHSGRMSLNASIALTFLGLALAGLDWSVGQHRIHPAALCATLAALPATCGFVGYLLGQRQFTGLLRSTNILLHAAVALFLLAVGIFAVRPQRRPVCRILADSPSGLLLRWLLPGSTMLMLILAWAIGKGRQFGLVVPGEGTALMLYGAMIVLPALILVASRAVENQELQARRAAAAFQEEEARFHTLADNISQLAWMADPAGQIVWLNQRWFEFAGTATPEWQDLIHPDHQQRVRQKLVDCLANGQPWEDLFPLRGMDGKYRWFLSRAMPIRDSSQRVRRWFGTHTDVTEQRALADELARAKERAERASQAKDHFLAALSHELRTPLTPVRLSVTALRDDERLPDDVRDELIMIERNVALEARLIDDLLDLTRIAQGKLPLRVELCDLHSLLGHAVEIIREDAQARSLEIKMDLAATQPGLKGDPARLQQVFWNLLKNAVKFTPAQGRIFIGTRDSMPPGRTIVEIRDTGRGFEAGAGEKLFLPFEQGAGEMHHVFGGLGLGLAIARAIVDLHGGKIRGESPGIGSGATFTVELPGATDSPSGLTASAHGADVEPSGGKPLRILLVDDHGATLHVLTKLLRRAGHEVVTANSVATALAAFVPERFDALVSDLGLSDGSGLELMTQLRILDPNIAGIALSGYGMEEDFRRTREAGFHTHLVKPLGMDELLQALERTCRTPHG